MASIAQPLTASHRGINDGHPFVADESFAQHMDQQDPLRGFRHEFLIPRSRAHSDGREAIYLCGNSLGLQPKNVRERILAELDDWARLGVEAHHLGRNPWLSFHEPLRDPAARLVGALPDEVVIMNSLTVNLHLLMATFYRPTASRFKIVIEDDAFPSDSYAVASQAQWHGFDPAKAIVRLKPRVGESTLRTQDILETLDREGRDGSIALLLLGGVNYLTGQFFDIPAITKKGHDLGAVVGWDLAHAAGNVELKLHDWNIDFAAWCSYKYLNSGPGAIAGAFVHERHASNPKTLRLSGWWGNDPATRFEMVKNFVPKLTADSWQLSNPPIFSMIPVKASLELFDRATLPALRKKSQLLTGYMEFLLTRLRSPAGAPLVNITTPTDPIQRGCQLSIAIAEKPREVHAALEREGVVLDFREPNIVRVAPVPMYNSFMDVWRFAQIIERVMLQGR